MLALRMAEMFPELEDSPTKATTMPWDTENEFICSKLAVYFEVHPCSEYYNPSTSSTTTTTTKKKQTPLQHPETVERLNDQGSTMRFYESCRALKGDEGPEMTQLVQAVERKRLYQQRKAWKKKHGSLWAHKPDSLAVVRVHPAMTLGDILKDSRMVRSTTEPSATL